MSKLVPLSEAAFLIQDGAMVAFGGSLLHRFPGAFARELARQGRRGLHFVKPSPGYEFDLLCRAGVVAESSTGIAVMEAGLGMLPAFRERAENGTLLVHEHSCIGIATGLRASAQGVPFLPIAGFQGSDLPERLGFKMVRDPYSDEELVAVPRIRPDWALIHVPESDDDGNARIYGSPFWDKLMARGSRRVIITTEQIVPRETLARQPELTAIPGLFVAAVVHAPRGSWPGSCHPLHGVDYAAAEQYLETVRDADGLTRHLDETLALDHAAAPAPALPR